MRGRPPLTSAAIKADGSYRKHRHADRGDQAFTPGESPEPPPELGPDGKKLWQDYFACAPKEILLQIDAATLGDACITWDRICIYTRLLRDDPLEKGIHMMLNKDQKTFLQYSARLGLSPVDRARLRIAPQKKDDDSPLAKLRAMRAG